VIKWSAIAGLTTARVTAIMVAMRANMVIGKRGGYEETCEGGSGEAIECAGVDQIRSSSFSLLYLSPALESDTRPMPSATLPVRRRST
jgi:hypothetical protein